MLFYIQIVMSYFFLSSFCAKKKLFSRRIFPCSYNPEEEEKWRWSEWQPVKELKCCQMGGLLMLGDSKRQEDGWRGEDEWRRGGQDWTTRTTCCCNASKVVRIPPWKCWHRLWWPFIRNIIAALFFRICKMRILILIYQLPGQEFDPAKSEETCLLVFQHL